MTKQNIYHETVPTYGMAAIFLAIAGWMAYGLYYQLHYGPFGTKPAPNSVFAIGGILAILIGLNFSAIRIRLTGADVRVSYGVFGKTLAWKDVASCEINTGSAALRYGGWGIRLGIIHGKRVWVYNTFGGTRVAYLTRGGHPSGMVVTTRSPDELIRVSSQMIGMQNR